MSKTVKPTVPPSKRRKSPRGGAYWSLFALCAALSFGAGFWYTYQLTSQISVRDPGANDAPTASPLPAEALVTPGPEALEPESTSQGGVVASDLGQAPSSAPTVTPRPTATPAAQAGNAAAPAGVYRVQVGSYSSREEAQAMVEELAVAGIDAMVVEDEGKFHAQIGAYGSRERALAVADDVNTKGYSVTIRH